MMLACVYFLLVIVVLLQTTESRLHPQETKRLNEIKLLPQHTVRSSFHLPLPHTYLRQEDLPDHFDWGNVNGTSYLTHSLNQYVVMLFVAIQVTKATAGISLSCWAHGALSSLADRIKIARSTMVRTNTTESVVDEINLSIQYILNCGGSIAGSCHGGSATGVYDFIKHNSGFIPYDTCMPYIACSADSTVGFCPQLDLSCSPLNTCRTCDGSGECHAVSRFPNATIAEFGTYSYFTGGFGLVANKIKAEIFARGPVAAAINADPLLNYAGGVVDDTTPWHMMVNHIVSIVGWGTDGESGKQYWICRNSWGEYWGEMGFFRIVMGHNSLGIESEVAWSTPSTFTIKNFPCNEDASNCVEGRRMESYHYVDPSYNRLNLFQHHEDARPAASRS